METLNSILVNSLYLLALLNPVSKVSVLAMASSNAAMDELRGVVIESTAIAAGILLSVMVFGDFILRTIFHVQLHSLSVAGGIVLFFAGFTALRKGVFFEQDTQARFADLAIVPLACPMIAGPATIAASLTLAGQIGLLIPICSVLLALSVNALIMLLSRRIGTVLSRYNILGALIRITGLIVMTMGIQMIFNGVSDWVLAIIKNV